MSAIVLNAPDVAPSHSPWGHVQSSKRIAPGIWFLSTASHGGFYLAPELLELMPTLLRENTWAGDGWFEEDCDYGLVVLAFPQFFTGYERFCAVSCWQFHAKGRAFAETTAGAALWEEFYKFKRENGDYFEQGCSSTGGNGWHHSARSISGSVRVDWQETGETYRDIPLPSPFTMEDINRRAIAGTVRITPKG